MKLTEVLNETYEIVDEMPAVLVYHGTTEEEAKNGLKNPDNFNTSWGEQVLPKNSIHFAVDKKVADAYAFSGVKRIHVKSSENKLNKAAEDWNDWSEKHAIELGLDPKPELLNYTLKYDSENFDKKYPNYKKLGKKEYQARSKVWLKDVREAAKKDAGLEKHLNTELDAKRGDGGYIIAAKLKPKSVLKFNIPFEKLELHDLEKILNDNKGKFKVVYFPKSILRPENYKGSRLPRTDYYITIGTNLLSDIKDLPL